MGWDSDTDGLYDDWELTYFGDLSQTADDNTDNDSLSNGLEQATLTHPEHSDIRGAIRSYWTPTEIIFECTNFLPTLDYTVEQSSDLQTWLPASISSVLGSHQRIHLAIGDITPVFYRVNLSEPE